MNGKIYSLWYRYDTETGLYYLQSRYYNPKWGRFINADGFAGIPGELLTANMFAYCANNPVTCIDPNGDFFFVPALIYGAAWIATAVTAILVAAPAIINEVSIIASTYGPQLMGAAQNLADKISGDSGGNNSSNPDPNKGKEIVEKASQIGNNSQIKNRALKDLTKKLGKNGVDDFTKAMNKGIVGPNGQNGIKRLAANTKIGGKVFEFEVKVFGEGANYRLYGNFDKSTGNYIWDTFGKALH